ncbi:hypothetical protein A3E39_01640 [Candidatus Uhrbacteria bacterium RIFCSPHIGHO2_12_FULL_60_25]|uniref:Smr domain-containing protein n=1 Tax=Candidatus Uhrbacteria bacterium RIFCSPHIGHO2_12_FULL_60_25 TaxID=1802399 RepID=A0A1F7UK26_9BACT|nr:MAG: hypothetical protein A3D73_01810 [Candidatus Uhrbacteria bacterium RIFCSPHIGHO2_02_FULL_60_44]OGL78619.1 MAG: hypothetical protein A3E39_01640 [Candidatus Uhrbacteria bacterium RIFCSPHIGHO2_12_FULL_60_25]
MPRRPEAPPSSEPIQTNPHESAIFAAELGEAPEINLHGESVDVAIRLLDAFVNHEFVAGTDVVKIIHGRGEGRLHDAVRDYLKSQTELVAFFRDAQAKGQQGGVTYAALHRVK